MNPGKGSNNMKTNLNHTDIPNVGDINSVACPCCGNMLEIIPDYIGRRVECPYCNTRFIISANENHVDVTSREQKPKIHLIIVMVTILISLIIVLSAVIIFMLVKKNDAVRVVQIGTNSTPFQVEKEVVLRAKPEHEKELADRPSPNDALKSCVTISCISGVGSGFFINHGGAIKVITCRHVIEDEPVVMVKDINGTEFAIKAISISKTCDIAVIDIEHGERRPICLDLVSDVGMINLDSALVCYGDSEGTGVIVPCYGKLLGIGPNSIETDTPFVPGNSGGPVIVKNGCKVVGVASVLTRLNEGNKWVKGTRFDKQTRHFAVRIDNLQWGELERTNAGNVKNYDLKAINKIAQGAFNEGNHDKAITLFTYSASKDDSDALNKLGEIFISGETQNDISAAIKLFEMAAQKKAPAGMTNLGLCYLYGRGVRKDSAKAFELFNESSLYGDPYGAYMTGICYRDGIGTSRDVRTAIKHLQKAAEGGEYRAKNELGVMYWNGNNMEMDRTKAFSLFSESAKSEYAEAECNLGMCYELGIRIDLEKAFHWYMKAAEKGVPRALFKIADFYDSGKGVVADMGKAAYWYEKAAEKGVPIAQCRLGNLYYHGSGVPQDFKKAIFWYRKAADAGDAQAQQNLGWCYKNGEGTPQNYTEAARWFRVAADNNLSSAYSALALMYRKGYGVRQNFDVAIQWYEKAVSCGVEDAKNSLVDTWVEYGDMLRKRNKKVSALFWYEKAANNGDAYCMQLLAEWYFNGYGCIKNTEKAAEWMKLAAKKTDRDDLWLSYAFFLLLLYSDTNEYSYRNEAEKILKPMTYRAKQDVKRRAEDLLYKLKKVGEGHKLLNSKFYLQE